MKMGHHRLETLALLRQLREVRGRREVVRSDGRGGAHGPGELPAEPPALPAGRQHLPCPREPPPATPVGPQLHTTRHPSPGTQVLLLLQVRVRSRIKNL